jgi:dolichyl-phosphooligosaccharide-protein glycotransferase
MSAVAEASSIFFYGDNFTLSNVFGNFTVLGFFVSILGIYILIANTYRKPKPEELLTLTWTVFILLAIYSQNRYACYYSINVSILSALVGSFLLEKVKWNELNDLFKANVKSLADIPDFLKFVRIKQVNAIVVIFCLLVIPVFGSALQYAGGSNDPNEEWLEACLWLRSNTPDPGMDYNSINNAPYKGEITNKGELFNYPDAAYGVMSWWDMGHYIEVIGHRMPNANPLQAGIGGRAKGINDTNRPGAATFFIAQSEKEADEVLKAIDPRSNRMGARDIMSDANLVTDGFMSIPVWTFDTEGYFVTARTETGDYYLPSTRYFNSMVVKAADF